MRKKSFVEQLVSDTKKNMSDKQLFTSAAFKRVVDNLVKGVGRMYNKTIRIDLQWGDSHDPIAGTNSSNLLFLNANNSMVENTDRSTRYRRLLGIVLHECGHMLYTPVSLTKKILLSILQDGILSANNTDNVNEYLAAFPKDRSLVAKVFKSFENSIEDGFIELVLLTEFPGYAPYLAEVRKVHLSSFCSVNEMRQNGLQTPAILFNMVLAYAKYHVFLDEEDSEDEATKAMYECCEVIDLARVEKNAKTRMQLKAEAFELLFGLLYKQKIQSDDEENQDDPSEEDNDTNNSSGTNSNSSSSTSSENDDSCSGSGEEESESESGSQSSGQSDKETDAENEDSKGGSPSENGKEDDSSDAQSDENSGLSSISSLLNDLEQNAVSSEMDENEHEPGEYPDTVGEDLIPDLSQSESEIFEAHSNSSSSEVESLEKEAAEDYAEEKNEELIRESLNTLKEGMDFGNYHSSIEGIIRRVDNPLCVNRSFLQLEEETKPVVRNLIRTFLKEVKERQQGYSMNGLYFGQRVSQPYRKDMKCFSKKIAPENIPDMSVLLLVDQSGSMDGNRIQAAVRSAFTVYKFCQALKIPVSVFGHCAGKDGTVTMECYADFNSKDGKDALRIASMSAHYACNRDGYALRFCSEKLLKQPTEKKLLMMISDGAPNDVRYGYKYIPTNMRSSAYQPSDSGNAKVDIQDVLRQYHRKGIRFITAGIGSDTEQIKDIYTDGLSPKAAAKFLSISKLDEMPALFVKILKKEILS